MTLLGGCGGGGGGGGGSPSSPPVASTPADGLGLSGQLAGTVKLDIPMPVDKSLLDTEFKVGLSDSGRALAAWTFSGSSLPTDHGINWVQSDPSGAWGKPAALPQAGLVDRQFRLAMRMNAEGSAALAYVAYVPYTPTATPQVARFIQGKGWDSAVYAPLGNNPSTTRFTAGFSWDLAMLSDNSFTNSGRVGSAFSVVQTRADGQQTAAVQADSASGAHLSDYSYFAANSTGDGLLYTVDEGAATPYVTHDISARFATVKQASFQPVPLGNFGTLCYHPNFEHPLVAVTTARGEGVMAATTSTPHQVCDLHELHMVRVYTQAAISIDHVRLNSDKTYLPVAPAIAVDRDGNALVVWMEATGKPNQRQANDVVRVMWSRAPRGGVWSTPQALAINTDAYGEDHFDSRPIALAMNADGKAVIAMRFGYNNPTISVRRFDFTSGWAPWQLAANKMWLSEPAVAMNAAGQAILVYSGIDAERVNGKAPQGTSFATPTRMFSLRF